MGDLRTDTPPRRSAEIELILRAVTVGGDGRDGGDADGPPSEPDLDWAYITRTARAHGVLAIVARSLKARGWEGVPAGVVQELTGYRRALLARNLFLSGRLGELLALLAGQGIAALPYKGPVLAAYAYGDVGLRPFSDLDILVSAGDVLRAKEVLLAHGYRSLTPRSDADSDRKAEALPPGYAFALRSADDRVLVELHWKLTPSFPLVLEDLLARAQPLALPGAPANR